MRVDVFSHPKDRAGIIPSDDVVLAMPDVFGIFDGATDPRGIKGVTGKSSGLFAAETVSRYCGRLFSDPQNFDVSVKDLMSALSSELANASAGMGYQSLPTSTLALALIGPKTVRLIVAGDSGIRVNGTTIYRHEKSIDDVSTAARVEVFKLLSTRLTDPNETEMVARRAIFQGIDTCISEGVLSAEEATNVIATVTENLAKIAEPDVIETFLRDGIKSQNDYGNDDNHALGFSVLNGNATSLKDVIDVTLDLNEIKTLELFSDGYFALPTDVALAAWEQTFAEIEVIDPHKVSKYPNVKGSTATDFSDDRSVIVLTDV